MKKAFVKVDKVLNNIRGRRFELNLTQYEMADRLAMSQHGYSKIENGLSQMSVERFIAIAAALETTIHLLVH